MNSWRLQSVQIRDMAELKSGFDQFQLNRLLVKSELKRPPFWTPLASLPHPTSELEGLLESSEFNPPVLQMGRWRPGGTSPGPLWLLWVWEGQARRGGPVVPELSKQNRSGSRAPFPAPSFPVSLPIPYRCFCQVSLDTLSPLWLKTVGQGRWRPRQGPQGVRVLIYEMHYQD